MAESHSDVSSPEEFSLKNTTVWYSPLNDNSDEDATLEEAPFEENGDEKASPDEAFVKDMSVENNLDSKSGIDKAEKDSPEDETSVEDSSLDEKISKCKSLQEQAAKELREISVMLRKQQKGMNIAKVSFSSAGVLAGSLGIAGLILAPLTGGISVGLTVASVGIGAASAAGGVSTTIAEFKVIRKRVEEAQKILDELEKETQDLIEKLKPKLKSKGISMDDFVLGVTSGTASLGKTVFDLVGSIKVAIKVVGATSKADQICITLAAQELPKTATGVVAKVGLNPTVVGNVAQVASVGFMGIGIGISLKEVFQNSKSIHKNSSKVADMIEEMASALENNE